MNLATNNHMEQQVTDEAVRCAKYFAKEVLETINDTETIGTLLDTMEFFHSVCSSAQLFTAMQILTEALDLTSMSEMLPYSQDNALSDLFFSSFMSEMVIAFIQMSDFT